MRPPLLNAYAVMLPRLDAEEELAAVRAATAGAGLMRPEARRRYIRELERAAGRMTRRRVRTTADLEAMGVKVTREVVKRG